MQSFKNQAPLVLSLTVYAMAELNSGNRDHVGCKAEKYSLSVPLEKKFADGAVEHLLQ